MLYEFTKCMTFGRYDLVNYVGKRMKQHKVKILSILIASAVLYGCNASSDDDTATSPEAASKEVQAYDGPVRGMIATATCDDETTGEYEFTDDEGNIDITLPTFVTAPETCSVEFVGGPNAVDMENNKKMTGVTYKAPKGLFKAGEKATASPLTTLIANKLGGQAYNDSAASEILLALGLDVENTAGISIKEFLTNTAESVEKIKSSNKSFFSKVAATKMILSDIITAQPDADPTKIAAVTKKLSEVITNKFPNFPENNGTGTDKKEIFFDFKEAVKDSAALDKIQNEDIATILDNIPAIKDVIDKPTDATIPEPTDPTDPDPTGTGTGTGSTGGGTGA